MKKTVFFLCLLFSLPALASNNYLVADSTISRKLIVENSHLQIDFCIFWDASLERKRYCFMIINKTPYYMAILGKELPPKGSAIRNYYFSEQEKQFTIETYSLLKNETPYKPTQKLLLHYADSYTLTGKRVENEVGTFAFTSFNKWGDIPISISKLKFDFFLYNDKIKIAAGDGTFQSIKIWQEGARVLFTKGFATELENNAVLLWLTPQEPLLNYSYVDFTDAIYKLDEEIYRLQLKVSLK